MEAVRRAAFGTSWDAKVTPTNLRPSALDYGIVEHPILSERHA
jgi:hypothetical protein